MERAAERAVKEKDTAGGGRELSLSQLGLGVVGLGVAFLIGVKIGTGAGRV